MGDGYTLPLYGAYKSIRSLRRDWPNLPKEFILKSNVQSDGFFIKHIEDKDEVDLDELLEKLKSHLIILKDLL